MERRVISSTLSNLRDKRGILTASNLDVYQAFILGYVCGIECCTDVLPEQIKLVIELDKQQNADSNSKKNDKDLQETPKKELIKDEAFDLTPPLDEFEEQAHGSTDKEESHENSKDGKSTPKQPDLSNHANSKSRGGYLAAFSRNKKNNNHKMAEEEEEEEEIVSEKLPQNNNQKHNLQRQNSDFDMEAYMRQFGDKESEEQKTLELIRQMQEADEAENIKDKHQRNQENEEIDCPICMCDLYTEAVLALENCDHVFHKECLLEYLKNKIEDRQAHIVCPDEKCKQEIMVEDFKQLLGKNLFEAYIKNSLESYVDQHADEMSWCPTPDCKYVFAYDEKEDEGFFHCPMCKKQYCLKCRVAFHKDMTCKEYQISNNRDQNDVMFEKFVKGKKFKQCIKCKFWVEKNQGCDHMTCRCKYEFCYKCGGKYRECACVEKAKAQMERLQQRRQLLQQKQKERQKKQPAPKARVGGRKRN